MRRSVLGWGRASTGPGNRIIGERVAMAAPAEPKRHVRVVEASDRWCHVRRSPAVVDHGVLEPDGDL
jgi:hypothetical protein